MTAHKPKKRVTMYLRADTLEKVALVAYENDRSTSQQVNYWLDKALSEVAWLHKVQEAAANG